VAQGVELHKSWLRNMMDKLDELEHDVQIDLEMFQEMMAETLGGSSSRHRKPSKVVRPLLTLQGDGSPPNVAWAMENCAAIFRFLDEDGSGTIDRWELQVCAGGDGGVGLDRATER